MRSVTAAISVLLATAVTVATATRQGLTRLRRLIYQIRTGAEDEATAQRARELAAPLQALRDAEAARDTAQTQLSTVEARVAESGGSSPSWPRVRGFTVF